MRRRALLAVAAAASVAALPAATASASRTQLSVFQDDDQLVLSGS